MLKKELAHVYVASTGTETDMRSSGIKKLIIVNFGLPCDSLVYRGPNMTS